MRGSGGHVRKRGAGWAFIVDLDGQHAQRCAACGKRAWVERERPGTECPKCSGALAAPQVERRQVWQSGFPTQKAAGKALRVFLGKVDAGRDALPRDMTVRQWSALWLASERVRGLRPHTQSRYAQQLADHLLPTLGSMQLDAVRPRHVRAALDAMAAKGLSGRSVNEARAILGSCFRSALEDELVEVNPVTAVRAREHRRKAQVTPTTEQLTALISAAKGTTWDMPIVLAAYLGLRRSEVLGLQWGDVDLDGAGLSVVRSLQRIRDDQGSRLGFLETKTETSRRQLDLGPVLVERLKRWKTTQTARRLRLGAAWVDLDLICDRGDGGPLDPDSFSTAFKRIAKKIGLPPAVRLHDVRHAVATSMLRSGVDAKIASAVLGHSTTSFTQDAYQHVLRGMTAAATGALDEALGS